MRQLCEALGRPVQSILTTQVSVPVVVAETRAAHAAKLAAMPEGVRRAYASSTIAGLPDAVAARYREQIDARVTNLIAGVYGDDRETVCLLAGRVVPTWTAAED
jgi:hypothetical protein